ncbi:MAG TPA: YhcH/YjgK/YiaL family protein [Salinimicrobium sp.]|nr:YhcH/YjgK/YiaL family protein [Salinimicrobium sp.]
MIIDKVENLSSYGLKSDFIIRDLKNNNFQSGKFMVADSQFGIGLEYETQPEEKAVWEAHRKYLDVHVILSGEECVQIADISNMDETSDYSNENDYQIFTGKKEQEIHLKPGCFLILFPHEVHKTSIQVESSTSVRKKVFKILI